MKVLSAAARRICAVPLFLALLAMVVVGCGGSADNSESRAAVTRPANASAAKPGPGTENPYALPVISHVQSAQLSAFALLRKGPEGLPPDTQRFFRGPLFGGNWNFARRIPAKAEGTYWLVPGDRHLCVISQGVMGGPGASATCAKTAEATAHGIATVSITPPGTPHPVRLIVGIAPDGTHEAIVHTRGAVAAVPVRNATFVLRDSTTDPPDFISLR